MSAIAVLTSGYEIDQGKAERFLQMEFNTLTLRAFAHSKKSSPSRIRKLRVPSCVTTDLAGSTPAALSRVPSRMLL